MIWGCCVFCGVTDQELTPLQVLSNAEPEEHGLITACRRCQRTFETQYGLVTGTTFEDKIASVVIAYLRACDKYYAAYVPSWGEIGEYLASRGLMTKTGKQWTPMNTYNFCKQRMLVREKYITKTKDDDIRPEPSVEAINEFATAYRERHGMK